MYGSAELRAMSGMGGGDFGFFGLIGSGSATDYGRHAGQMSSGTQAEVVRVQVRDLRPWLVDTVGRLRGTRGPAPSYAK